MKKLLLLLTACCFFTSSFAAFEIKPVARKATEIFIPVGKNMKISLMDLSSISIKDVEKLTGKRMNFIDRIGFKAGQKKLRKSIAADGTITNKKLLRFVNGDGQPTGFHVGGFLLGFFGGLIGVAIAYVAGGDDDIKRNRAKWAWIGFGLYVVIILALFLSGVFTLDE